MRKRQIKKNKTSKKLHSELMAYLKILHKDLGEISNDFWSWIETHNFYQSTRGFNALGNKASALVKTNKELIEFFQSIQRAMSKTRDNLVILNNLNLFLHHICKYQVIS